MRTWDKVALVFVAVVALSAVLITALTNVADRQLAASQAKVRVPERIAFYEELAKPDETPAAQAPDAQAPPQAVPNPADPVRIARDTITAYSELFEKASGWARERERDKKPLLDWNTSTKSLDIPQELIEQIIATSKRGGPVSLLNFSAWDKQDQAHLNNIELCAALVKAYAEEKAVAGDYAEALRGFMAAMDLADALSAEPLVSSLRTRQEIYEFVMLTAVVAPLSPDLAKALIERLSKADNRAALRDALAGDLQMELHAFDTWKHESYTGFVSRIGFYWGTRSWLWATPVCQPWFDKDQQVTIDLLTRMIQVENLPYYEVKPVLDQIQADNDALSVANMAAQPRIRWHLDAFVAQANFEFELNFAQLKIAIEQYRRAHGDYPETLDAVSDWFGGTLPVNPLDGKPYSYTSDGKTYSLDNVQLNTGAGR